MRKEIKETSDLTSSIVRSERMSSQISRQILAEIQSGQMKAGDRLPSESILAQRYGVSRTILREAIASLKNDDILEAKPGRGLIVKDPDNRQAFRFSDVFATVSLADICHFYEMRTILESEAARLAAIRCTAKDMQAIKDSFSEMERAVEEQSLGDEAHTIYNSAIAYASHNPVLIEFSLFLQNKLRSLAKELRIKTMSSPERAKLVLDEHRLIVQAIMQKNPDGAKKATEQHLINAASRAGIHIFTK